MNITTLDKQTMDALELLAQTNVKIGEAKGILLELQQAEQSYLEEREKKALAQIQKVLDESDALVKQIHSNHEQATSLYNTVSSYVAFLAEMLENVQLLIEGFDKKSDYFEKYVAKEEVRLANIRREVEIDRKRIESDKKTIEKAFKTIEKEKTLIESRQSQIKEALKVLEKKQNER